jgi:hypothetical protein
VVEAPTSDLKLKAYGISREQVAMTVPVTTKYENGRVLRDNAYATGERARNNPMVLSEPVEQVGAGRRRNSEVTPPSGEFVRENL